MNRWRSRAAAAADARDGRWQLWSERAAILDRGGANLREQIGLGCLVVLDFVLARQSTATLEIARHAPSQRGGEFGDMLVLERQRGVEFWRELSWHATVCAVEEQRMEVQIKIKRTPESLHEDHRARARVCDALLARSTLPRGASLTAKRASARAPLAIRA